MNLNVNENVLDRVLLCPIIDMENSEELYLCASEVLRWSIRKSFDHNKLTLKDIREKFVQIWNKRWIEANPKDADNFPKSGPYWDGPRQASKTAKKIFDFLKMYEIIHPEQPYMLPLELYTIQGWYSLIRRRGKKTSVLVLSNESVERNHHSKPESTLPKVSCLCRYKHVKNTYAQYKQVSIYNLPLLHGSPWINRYVDEKIATKNITSVINYLKTEPCHAVAGPHCSQCTTKRCLEMIHEKPTLNGI